LALRACLQLCASRANEEIPGEPIFQMGQRGVPAWFLLEGSAELFGRAGLDEEIALRELESGQFTGELHQLADKPTLAGARAGAKGCVALPLDAGRLRALIVGSAELGELIMRAFILRRVGLLERGVGPVLLGRAGSAELLRLQAFLTRSAYPHLVINCASERGRQLINDLALPPEDLPHIFDRFYRSVASRSLPGSGLGLAIVRDIVESHGGQVFAEAREGGGTTVGFTLPTLRTLPTPAAPPLGPPAATSASRLPEAHVSG